MRLQSGACAFWLVLFTVIFTEGEAEKMAPSSNHATTYDLTQYPISVGMQSMAGGLCYPLPLGKVQIDISRAEWLFFFNGQP